MRQTEFRIERSAQTEQGRTSCLSSCHQPLKHLVNGVGDSPLSLRNVKLTEIANDLIEKNKEAAGADDCWTHDVIGDWKEIITGNIKCNCEK